MISISVKIHLNFNSSPFAKKLIVIKYFLYPATLKSAGYYVIPSVQKFAFECPSVCPSVSASFPLYIRVDIRKEWFGIVDEKISSIKSRVMALD